MIATLVMAILLVIYLAFTVNYAWILIQDDALLVNAMGYALMVLPVLGAWGLAAEMRFAVLSQKLTRTLEAEGALPHNDFPTHPSGRPDREAAEKIFPRYAEAVEKDPSSWRAWLALGVAYDACGDRRRARWAVRKAISLHRKR